MNIKRVVAELQISELFPVLVDDLVQMLDLLVLVSRLLHPSVLNLHSPLQDVVLLKDLLQLSLQLCDLVI